MSLEVKLEQFQGPLEVLYNMIQKNKIDIYDIPVATIADQYMEYVQGLPRDMESISSFLVMAAELIRIKSKMLLWGLREQEEADPREEIVSRLEEYEMFLEIAEILKEKSQMQLPKLYKDKEKDLFEKFLEGKENVIEQMDIALLKEAFLEVLRRQPKEEEKITTVPMETESITVEEKIRYIENYLKQKSFITFVDLVKKDKLDIVVTFMALLEMVKAKAVKIKQTENFKEIQIWKKI